MIESQPKTWTTHRPPAEAGSEGSKGPQEPPTAAALDPELERRLEELGDSDHWHARAGRRNAREKLNAGLLGLKQAVRGDSSFFAHAYRGILIALTAAMLGVGPLPWCLLVLAASLVMIAELSHSAVDTLARALGDPDEPGLKVAREIATGGVLVAVFVMAAVSITVFTVRLGELFSWW